MTIQVSRDGDQAITGCLPDGCCGEMTMVMHCSLSHKQLLPSASRQKYGAMRTVRVEVGFLLHTLVPSQLQRMDITVRSGGRSTARPAAP